MFLIHLLNSGFDRVRFSRVPLSTKEQERVFLFGYCYASNKFLLDEFWLKHRVSEEV